MKKITWILLVSIFCIVGMILNAIYFNIIYQLAIMPIVELFGYQLPFIDWSIFFVGLVALNAINSGKKNNNEKFYRIGDNGFFKEFTVIIFNKVLKAIGVVLTYYILRVLA